MLIIPAIDLKDGKVVRLLQGDFNKTTVYPEDPVHAALRWESEGASLLHIVDLDGALTGSPKNIETVRRILKNIKNSQIEFGGGVRTEEDIEMLFKLGITKVILGTAACEDEGFLKNVVKEFGTKILVSIDARDGIVATKGWRGTTNGQAMDFIKRVKDLGVDEIIYTNIAKDGALAGPDIQGIKKILDFLNLKNITSQGRGGIIASGGVSSLEDVKKLKEMEPLGLVGVIIGKALYEGKIDLKEAIKC